ncbi:MAG: penicillin-binding protein 1A [Sphingomonadales bacterium]|nr:penicillin-binding protein 1A [Sphingomonadales bacterium]
MSGAQGQTDRTDDLSPLQQKARKALIWFASVLGGGAVAAALAVLAVVIGLNAFGRNLPDYKQLQDYEPPIVTRIYAGDGSMLTEFARQQRSFVPINAIPRQVINAFLAAEDKNFYRHYGVDYLGIVRAVLVNLKNVASDRRKVGASTITQQVAKNFLLSNEVSYERKIKEAILAFRMERAFSKDRILELYLNEIYLGNRSYGVAAAALNYFNKSLDQLTLAEAAYLAALPKAPSNYHPVRKKEAAVARRNWVISRMRSLGFVDDEAADAALVEPLVPRSRAGQSYFRADYFEEEVRRELKALYGDENLYAGGLYVRTTLEPRLQAIAERVLRRGLFAYDRRHGWRGPVRRIALAGDWHARLNEIDMPLGIEAWELAVVLEVSEAEAVIGLADRSLGVLPLDQVKWAQRWLPGEFLGRKVEAVGQVLSAGDVVVVERLEPAGDDEVLVGYALRQIPDVEGALVAMDPHTGRVLAMVGGWDYRESEYNRATQAERQPGSAFKPFVYAAALEAGYTPSSLVLDAPFVIDQGDGQGKWKPRNSSNKFYGPSTLRVGIERSRNLMTVRLALAIGIDKVVDYAGRVGLDRHVKPTLASALGAGEVNLVNMTTAYSMLVNGGSRIKPTLIDRIQDRRGRTIFRHDDRPCPGCALDAWEAAEEPVVPDGRSKVLDHRTAYQIVSMLEGVVQRGTGRSIRALGIPLAGKTGTTNDAADGWFVGFSPDLAVGVFVGFDQPRSLGPGEEGSSVASPIFKAFMAEALKDKPRIPFRIPSGIRLVRVDPKTGLPADPSEKSAILEAFIPGTEPNGRLAVLDGGQGLGQTEGEVRSGTGGLY